MLELSEPGSVLGHDGFEEGAFEHLHAVGASAEEAELGRLAADLDDLLQHALVAVMIFDLAAVGTGDFLYAILGAAGEFDAEAGGVS